jgi:thiol-disulfide isomerase/thioredoxin
MLNYFVLSLLIAFIGSPESVIEFNYQIKSDKDSTLINTNDSLGIFVTEYDFGATLFMSEHGTLDEMMDQIKSRHKGKTLILDLWGTFCPPCLADFQKSSAVKEELRDNNVEIIYLCAGKSSSPQKWKEVVERMKLKGDHIYMDRAMTIKYMERYKFRRYPGYLLIDSDGNYDNQVIKGIANIKVDQFLSQVK